MYMRYAAQAMLPLMLRRTCCTATRSCQTYMDTNAALVVAPVDAVRPPAAGCHIPDRLYVDLALCACELMPTYIPLCADVVRQPAADHHVPSRHAAHGCALQSP